MPAPDVIHIKPLPVTKIRQLHRLFVAAVRTNFTYFDDEVQEKVINDHRPLRLLSAVFSPRRVVLSAWNKDELVGYAIGSVPTGGEGQLYWLYVTPSNRGSNTGLALLSRMLRRQRQLGAHSVTLATYDHRRYYERQGFACVETRDVDGVDMDVMRYQLS